MKLSLLRRLELIESCEKKTLRARAGGWHELHIALTAAALGFAPACQRASIGIYVADSGRIVESGGKPKIADCDGYKLIRRVGIYIRGARVIKVKC